MNLTRYFPLMRLALAVGLASSAAGAVAKRKPAESDLATPDARALVVELAARLAKVEMPESVANNSLPRPFNPPGFGLTTRPVAETKEAGPPPKAFGDREILIALAPKVQPKSTMSRGSTSLLMFGTKGLRPGDRLTVNYEGQDYSLQLVSFDTINFTLRLNKEEITRPIKPGKNP